MNDSLLRRAIRLDATGVGLLGLAAAAFAESLATTTGVTTTQLYVTAVAFIAYGFVGNFFARLTRVVGIGMGLSAFNFIGTIGALALVASAALPIPVPVRQWFSPAARTPSSSVSCNSLAFDEQGESPHDQTR